MPSDDLVKAEFFTTTHRITAAVETGPKPLSDLLNDRTQSYLLVSQVYISRLTEPGKIDAHAPVAFLSKENLNVVIVPAREARPPDPGRFAAQAYETLVTLPGFEVRGKFVGPRRIDLRSFSPATLDAFVTLTGATARLATAPEEIFSGDAILVNRAHLESICLLE